MKKFSGSIVVGLLLSSFALAGGDIAPVEPAVVVPAPVVDDSGFYVGVAYSAARYDGDYNGFDYIDPDLWEWSGTEEVDYDGIMAQVGYKFNQYIALEGRYWWSLGDGDWSDRGSQTLNGLPDISWNNSGNMGDDLRAWGIYVKPMFPVTEQFDIYALLGGGNVRLSDNGGEWLDESDFQWGIGASYEFTENLAIFVDYVRLLDDSHSTSYVVDPVLEYGEENWDDTVYTINVGLTYKF
jgi:opacity protein-like surface antigen